MEDYIDVKISHDGNLLRSFSQINSESLLGTIAALSMIHGDVTLSIKGEEVSFENKIVVTGSGDLVVDYKPTEDGYYLWVGQNDYYSLYHFYADDFLTSFLATSAEENVDFRDISADPPFLIIDDSKSYLGIVGYEISRFSNVIKIPAPVIPFMTNVNESDPYGLDYE